MKENSIAIHDISIEKRKITWSFILTVLLIYPLPQLAIDIYLPSWPAMVNAFHTNNEMLQFSLIIYVLFLGIAQLIYGPLSDRYGRKPILLFGCTLFFIASLAAIFVNSINQFLILRAIQGLGIGCGFAVASAILADIFSGKKLAQYTSYSAMVYSSSLIFAPVIGGYLQHYIGWRANLTVMTIYALILCLLIKFLLFETKKLEKSPAISFLKISKNYLSLLTNFSFICLVNCLILSYGVMIAFNIIAPFLILNTLHLSEITYGKLLLIVGVSYLLGAMMNSQLLNRFSIHTAIWLGLTLMIMAGLGLLMACIFSLLYAAVIILFVCIAIFGMGFIYPNCFAKALDVFPEKGYTSAFIGSAILIGVSLVSGIVSYWDAKPLMCLAYTCISLSVLSAISYFIQSKR